MDLGEGEWTGGSRGRRADWWMQGKESGLVDPGEGERTGGSRGGETDLTETTNDHGVNVPDDCQRIEGAPSARRHWKPPSSQAPP